MKNTLITILAAIALPVIASAQIKVNVNIDTDPAETHMIPKEIYGQFAEHLGSCIYGGLWVGPDSEIPNIDGYRTDVLEALKALKVPVMRWPGGCFADEYHWRRHRTKGRPSEDGEQQLGRDRGRQLLRNARIP